MTNSISLNFGVATLGRVGANIIGFVTVALLTRILGPEQFGNYNAIFAYLFFFTLLADMGLGTLLVREISQHDDDEARIIGALFVLRLILILASCALALAVVWFLDYPYAVKIGVAVGALSIVCSSLVQVVMGVFQKHLKLTFVTISEIVTRTVQLVGVLYLVSYDTNDLLPYVWVVVGASIVHFLLVYVFAQRVSPFRWVVDVPYWKTMLVNALPIAASLFFVLIYFKIDTLMLSLMRTPSDVGIYSLGYKVLEVVIFIPAVYVGLIMPVLSRSAHNRDAFLTLFSKTLRLLFIGGSITMVAMMLFAPLAVSLIGGPGYESATAVIRILGIAAAIIFVGNIAGHAIIALNLQRKGMWIYAAGAVLNILLNLIFIPKYGYIAASWTTVVTEIVVTAGMLALIFTSLARQRERV